MITYPPGQITTSGARRLLEITEPHVTYQAYDDSMVFHLMGPLAPTPGVQPGIVIADDSIKGLIPSWRTLDQVGANQDGVTFQDAVYEPAELDLMVEAHGRNPTETRQVIRDWISAWDAKKQGELSVFTPEQGLWWAKARWLKAPTDPLMNPWGNRQRFLWTARLDNAFWRSYDSVGQWQMTYEAMKDTFGYTAGSQSATSLGANWPLRYAGPETTGYIYTADGQARWEDADPLFNTDDREVVCGPYKDFNTSTDYQAVTMWWGSIPEIAMPDAAGNDVWVRMGRNGNGTWNGYGVRLRVKFGQITLSRFNNFVETQMVRKFLRLNPLKADRFTLVAGYEGNARLFKVLRNGVEIAAHKEEGTGSALGASYRGIGFGMYAAGSFLTQATPANIKKITAGDNSTVSQQGYLTLTNIGDIDSWPRYLLYGPGTFYIGNGPDSQDYVEFGPILDGQVVLLETEPRLRSVVDLTPSTVETSDVLTPFQKLIGLEKVLTLAANRNHPPLLRELESQFGVLPPQGNLYSYLTGRFSNPIPAKTPGAAASTSTIWVKIDNGNASSRIVGAVTPYRRWPL